MGIPYYFSHIIKTHPNIIKKLIRNETRIDNFFLDSNSIIYDAFHKLDKTKMTSSIQKKEVGKTIIHSVITKIEKYIQEINPLNITYVAFDGVAPFAKMDQQRTRRYKSAFLNNIKKSLSRNENGGRDGDVNDIFDTVSITPGTMFMKELGDTITEHFKKNSNIIISTSEEYGEGEHKIFQFIRENPLLQNGNIAIYGLDADLIMLSINHLYLCSIFLVRETPHFVNMVATDKSSNSDEDLNVLDIKKLDEALTTINGCSSEEYVFLCFLMGNDFLPHFPALNIRTGGIDKIMEEVVYNKKSFIIENGSIKWENFYKLISSLAKQEERFIIEEFHLRNKTSKRVFDISTPEKIYEKFESIPVFEREMEKYINPLEKGWQERYYKVLFNIDFMTYEKKRIICLNFLEMLEWCFKYYKNGCPNWKIKYNYHYPPLLEDLVKFIPVFNKEFVPYQRPEPVLPIVQLIYVLPKESLKKEILLSQVVSLEVKNKLFECKEWYKSDNEFIWAFCKYFWESHICLPNISIQDIENKLIISYPKMKSKTKTEIKKN